MHIQVKAHHPLTLTEAIKKYVEEKCAHLEDYHRPITRIEVTLDVRKIDKVAKAVLHTKGADLFAEATSKGESDLYAAIDALVHRLKKQLIAYKERQQGHNSGPNGGHPHHNNPVP